MGQYSFGLYTKGLNGVVRGNGLYIFSAPEPRCGNIIPLAKHKVVVAANIYPAS